MSERSIRHERRTRVTHFLAVQESIETQLKANPGLQQRHCSPGFRPRIKVSFKTASYGIFSGVFIAGVRQRDQRTRSSSATSTSRIVCVRRNSLT